MKKVYSTPECLLVRVESYDIAAKSNLEMHLLDRANPFYIEDDSLKVEKDSATWEIWDEEW